MSRRVHWMGLGRAGNCAVSYLFARGYCERHGFTLCTDEWPGELAFDISHPRCTDNLPRRDENDLVDGESEISFRSYCQRAKCAEYYSLRQVKEWLRFRPDVEFALQRFIPADDTIVAHFRRGDFAGYQYPLVSKQSYVRACEEHGLNADKLYFVSDECPTVSNEFHGGGQWVIDFFIMSKARTLLRANSSYSFVAGLLVEAHGGRVFSPVIDGLVGGIEHEVRFVAGNHPRLSDHDFVDELRVQP